MPHSYTCSDKSSDTLSLSPNPSSPPSQSTLPLPLPHPTFPLSLHPTFPLSLHLPLHLPLHPLTPTFPLSLHPTFPLTHFPLVHSTPSPTFPPLGRNMVAAQNVATSLLRGVLSGFAGSSHKHLASHPLESKRDTANRHHVNGGEGPNNGASGMRGIMHSPSLAGMVSPHSVHGMSHSPAGELGDIPFRYILSHQHIRSTHPINPTF